MINKMKLLVAISMVAVVGSAVAQSSPSPYTFGNRYDLSGHLVGKISPDPDGAGPLAYAAIRYVYSSDQLIEVDTGELSSWQSEVIAPNAWTGFTVFRTQVFTYDAFGRKLTEKLSASGVDFSLTQYSYDQYGRLQCSAVRMNPAVFSTPPSDACTLGTQGLDGPDRITKYTNDDRGRVLKVQRAFGTAQQQDYATYEYDSSGTQISATDANNNYSFYAYDGFNRLSRWYFPSQTAGTKTYNPTDYEEYTYDSNSNRTTLRKRDGNTITYGIDPLNRVTSEVYPTGSIANIYYGYDLRGLQLYARFNSSAATAIGITNTYDGFGHIETTSTNQGGVARTLSYRYDADGNRTRITHPDGQYFVYGYDGLDRATTILENGSTLIAAISFDNQGRRSTLTRGATVSRTTYGYDNVSRLQALTQDLAGTSYDETRTFSYNAANQVTSRTLSNGVYSFSQVPTTTTNYQVNGLNEYTQFSGAGTVTPGYDLNGNMRFDGGTTFGYDILNRMTSASGAKTVNLAYDPKGRLFQTSGGASGTTQFLYDGDELVAEYNGAGTLMRRYVHGPGVDEPLVSYEGSTVGVATRRYFHVDHQGSVIVLADMNGNAIQTNTYDPYGVPAAGNAGRFQYTGQIMLPDLGQYYYKARIYNPTLGRFMQTDPVGYKDDLNLYSYVAGDPINKSDPSGKVIQLVGDDEFKRAAAAQLKQISSKPEGAKIVKDLRKSKNIIKIELNTESNSTLPGDRNEKATEGVGSTVSYDPRSTRGGADSTGSHTRPGYVGLGHELGHAWALDHGIQSFDRGTREPGTIPPSERESVRIENLIRHEHNLPIRPAYYE